MHIIEGNYQSGEIRVGIVAPRFNEAVVSRLISGAEDGLVRHGVKDGPITLVRVPGAFEIPSAAKKMALSGRYDAVICLGAVIRGETSHYDYVCAEVSKGIASAALETGIPVLFGVLTTDTIEQAMNRAGLKSGNKGFECALDALEMASLFKQIK